MTDRYKELSRRATRGDVEAMRELFAYAEQHETEHRFREATEVFRDVAIAYRISAFRNLARAQDAESRVAWLDAVRIIYQKWLDENPNGLRKLPRPESEVDHECIRRVVVEQLVKEEPFVNVFRFLEDTLSTLGMEFYSPGGSIQRRVCQLLGEVFGLGISGWSEYLQHTVVRVGLDQIADEVAKRCQGVQSGSSRTTSQTARR